MSTRKPSILSTSSATQSTTSPTPNPPPSPPPQPASPPPASPATATPPPDPNAALELYVQQTVSSLDGVEVGLGSDPALTPTQKRHAAKLRKGGDKIISQIGNLAQQEQLESPALNVPTMVAALGKAQALQPLADRLTAFVKHVNDVIFTSQSDSLVMAQQFYALLQRRALTDNELSAALQPVAAFFAYRHPVKKAPGTPTKPQKKATTKAVKTLKKLAPQALAPAASDPQGQPAAGTGAAAPAAPPAANGAPPAPTNGAAPAGGSAPAHS